MRVGNRWLVLLCVVFVLLPVAAAYAATQQTYATGQNGVGGVVYTTSPKYADRNYNQVWHASGYSWTVWYQDTGGSIYCNVTNNTNPTKCNSFSASKWALAQNNNDNSSVTWTAQTTVP